MRRSLVERSLNDVHGRLTKARQELAVLDEQLVVMNDIADDLQVAVSRVGDAPCSTRAQRRSAPSRSGSARRAALVETVSPSSRSARTSCSIA